MDHSLFSDLFSELNHFLEINKIDTNLKDRDAKILSHAFLWDYHNLSLQKPHFITVDETDICDNRTDIKNIAQICLKKPIRLSLFTVKEMVEWGF